VESAALLALFHSVMQSDLPDGRARRIPVQPSRKKYSASVFQKYVISVAHPVLATRGARDRHERWVRDAVDAAASGAYVGWQGGLCP
jgi:hypothetical protein